MHNNNTTLPCVLNYYKYMTQQLCVHKGWNKATIEQVWLYLTEEFGELAASIRRGTRQYCDNKEVRIQDELGDVFSYLFQIAFMLNIDLDAMWHNHQLKAYSKIYQSFDNSTLMSSV